MKKALKIVRNIIVGVFLFVYLSFIILISTLLLNRNDYGVTQFGNKALIKIDEQISTDDYKLGSLVIVEQKKIEELNINDEIFVYKTNKRENTLQIIISKIGKINTEQNNSYVVLANDGTSWGEDFIAGTEFATYEKIGTILSFIESKWVFFCLLIVPCFFILLYEIHLVIVTVKFGDLEDEELDETTDQKYMDEIESKNEEIAALMKKINALEKEKEEKTEIKSKKEETKTEKKKTK